MNIMETKIEELKHSIGDGSAKFVADFQSAEKVVGETIDKAKVAVDSGVHSVQQTVNETIDRAKLAATNAANSASDAACYVGQKADSATSSIGNAMENTGLYLKDDGLHHITKDVTELIRRNPMPAMLIGVGLGFLVALAANRRSA
jgi:ElaB/YqjD/DUF883 family membrane-anchored ribosome-binding protein